jgi:FtsH-binding integral membrane protein
MSLNTGVFDRHGTDSMGMSAFMLSMGAAVIYGLGMTAYMAYHTANVAFNPGWAAVLILGLAIPIGGICIAVFSDNPFFSFIGYNMVLIPFGIILGPTLRVYANKYSPDIILHAFLITMGVTMIMCALSVLFPDFFSKIGGALFAALIGLVVVRVVQIFVPGLDFTIVDWIGAGIFSLYIGFDFWRATQVPRTLDNAVDIALDLYLDIINLFLNILRILAASRDK